MTMKYRNIVSVSKLGGLYQLMTSKNNSAIVKSLDDGSNKFISSRQHQVTPLESIEIYTVGDNIYLYEVLEKLKSADEEIHKLDFKDAKDFVPVFAKAVPEYDVDRVYNSDIKKILKWYILLKKNDLLDFSEYFNAGTEEDAEHEAKEAEVKTEETDEKEIKKSAKKTTAKKSAAKTKETKETEVKEEKAAKKTSTKKTTVKKKKTEE